MAAGDPLAFDAWEEFYERHGGYLLGVCKRAYTGRVGEYKIEDIVQDALVRAFQKAGTLHADDSLDRESQCHLVRGWLSTICQHIVSDYFRGQPEVDFVDDQVLETHKAVEPQEVDPTLDVDCSPMTRLQLMEEAIETLTDREQEVLRTTMMWFKPNQEAQKLPHSVMTELTGSLKTNPGNIRKIRERAMTKLRNYIESHEQDTKE
jgi:RNA polymerase sigma factor (sigma-70 family)